MKRYAIYCGTGHNEGVMDVFDEPDGDWVKFEDIATLTARVAELEKDAARYRWLRDRINWRDEEVTTNQLVSKVRFWTHWDWRESPPASEHIDEYIDGCLAGADSESQS